MTVHPNILLAAYLTTYLLLGGGIILKAIKNLFRGKVFDENFLMTLATIGAFAIGQPAEAVAVMLFFRVGEYFQDRAVDKSKASIAALMDIRPDFARLKQPDNTLITVDSETVQPGDLIVVQPGEKVPLDGTIEHGQSTLDTKALTGESAFRAIGPGDTVLSGSINHNGVLTIRTTAAFADSTVSKILDLVENAATRKAPTESFITTFARYYTPAVVATAALVATVPPLLFGAEWTDWISRSLIFLVISCPCALVISIPLSYFGGIGSASRRGILVKGGNYLDALTRLDTVIFDKTGTLTQGVFEVTKLQPAQPFTETELLEAAARAESFSNHPIALSIRAAARGVTGTYNLTHFTVPGEHQEIAGQGVSVRTGNQTILVGNRTLMESHDVALEETESTNATATDTIGTTVYVAIDKTFAGSILISDKLKPDSKTALAELKKLGVKKTVMLTGDNARTADATARELGIDSAFGDLLPEDKVTHMDALLPEHTHKSLIAFVGDGINDAPVLAMADLGIAMGALGSDAAIEAADVVLMTDEPSKLVEAVELARATRRIVWQNIIFALGIKVVFMLLGTMGIASLWEAVFADVGVTLLAILNASRLLGNSSGTTPNPNTPNPSITPVNVPATK